MLIFGATVCALAGRRGPAVLQSFVCCGRCRFAPTSCRKTSTRSTRGSALLTRVALVPGNVALVAEAHRAHRASVRLLARVVPFVRRNGQVCTKFKYSSISQRGLRYNRKIGSGCKRLSNSGDCTETGRLGQNDCDPGGGGLARTCSTKPHEHVCRQPMQKGPC